MLFQVVPPCGGHLTPDIYFDKAEMFQVVPPCGGHQGSTNRGKRDIIVSSRAPVWGASGDDSCLYAYRKGFKSCPRVGGIALPSLVVSPPISFQVVPPCGGHLEGQVYTYGQKDVSSRAPVWGASVILHKKHVANLCKICIFLPNCRF